MPMDENYGFEVVGNVPSKGAKQREALEKATLGELVDRIVMLEQENAELRKRMSAFEKELRLVAMKARD